MALKRAAVYRLIPTKQATLGAEASFSLVYRRGFDAIDQMNRYCNWYNVGYLSSTGECFDIGATVAAALRRYLDHQQQPYAGSTDARAAGNGALMRLAPIAMFYARDPDALFGFAADSMRTTHGADEALQCSRLFALQLRAALASASKQQIFDMVYPAPLDDDADTTASICGQLAGAHYGVAGIPPAWLQALTMRDEIVALADSLLALRVPQA